MRKVLFVLAIALCFSAFGYQSAQAAQAKIGVFNMAIVIPESDAYKAKLAELQKEFDTEGKALEKETDAFQKEVNDFQVQQQALSAQAREDRQISLQRKKRDLDDKTNNFLRKRNAAEKKAQDEISRVIIYAATKFGERENYGIIMEQNNAGALLVAPEFDITKQILQESNKVWKEKPKEIFGGR